MPLDRKKLSSISKYVILFHLLTLQSICSNRLEKLQNNVQGSNFIVLRQKIKSQLFQCIYLTLRFTKNRCDTHRELIIMKVDNVMH